MSTANVIIVGAGPTGLTLAAALAKYQISSIILEKEQDITDDPRGVYLTGDAVRILYDIGIGHQIKHIGHLNKGVCFHKTSFANDPFYSLDTSGDNMKQFVPGGILQIQPDLERALCDVVEASGYCDLRRGCKVTERTETENDVTVRYQNPKGATESVSGSWLVGADGKKGVVRKEFLEKSAGIRQDYNFYKYDGTWIASNLKIKLPTYESHPGFPLWRLGFTPERVYNLFWPEGWHFVSPPGKATASGRFGPSKARMWRHEFEQNDWNDEMDPVEMFWEHITPMVTRTSDEDKRPFSTGPVAFPRDCIEILRCRPFIFTHKMVNKWFHNRTILAGDAAAVYPPFGGQGIATGIGSAHQLSWRLALLSRLPKVDRATSDRLLNLWSEERRCAVNNSALMTKMNGTLCNEGDSWAFFIYRNLEALRNLLPFLLPPPHPLTVGELKGFNGFRAAQSGHFIKRLGGGRRVAQICVESLSGTVRLSDALLHHDAAVMTLLVLGDDQQESVVQAKAEVKRAGLDPFILSDNCVQIVTRQPTELSKDESVIFYPSKNATYDDCVTLRGYEPAEYFKRLEYSRFALVRPDFYVFALAKDQRELADGLSELKAVFSP